MDWISLFENGDVAQVLIVAVLVIITGGVGAAIATGIFASRRGVKGDALVKEQNGINGLDKLTNAQGNYIDRLEKRINEMEQDFNEKIENLEAKLHDEVAYSNLLINTLSENTIPIPPRPIKNNTTTK